MKKTITILTIIFFTFLITSFTSAQSLEIDWNQSNEGKYQLYDFMQTNDGQFIGVGESFSADNQVYATIFYFDSLGVLLQEPKVLGGGKEGFRAIAQTHEGTFLLVGWTQTLSKDGSKDGWIVEIDQACNMLQDTVLGTSGVDIFEKIALKEDGSALIGGFKNQGKEDGLWLVKYNRRKGTTDQQHGIGNIKPKNIIAMMPCANNKVLIAGNTKDESTWRVMVDDNSTIKPLGTLGGKFADVLFQGSQTYDDKMLLTGETLSKAKKGFDAWLIELDEQGNAIHNDPLDSGGDERSLGAVKVLYRNFAIVLEEDKKSKNIVWFNQPKESKLSLPDATKIDIVKIINLFGNGNEFLIVGNIKSKQKPNGIRLIKIKSADYLASKEDVLLNCSTPQLLDDSQDTAMGPNEMGNLSLTLTNPSSSEITNIRVQCIAKNAVAGLTVQDIVMGSYIAPKGKKTMYIPVKSGKQINDGMATFDLIVKVNGQEACRTVANVKCLSRIAPRTSKNITLISPKPSNRAERSEKPEQIINVKVKSPQPLSNTDIRVYKNKKVLKDSKANNVNWGEPTDLDGLLQYDSYVTVPLDTGINIIEIEILDEASGTSSRTEKLTVEYAVHKPTLHIVAIAPTYENLKYNRKDVNDLMDLLEKQRDSGIYENILKEVMLTEKKTSFSSMRAIFEVLSNKFQTGKIHPSDVLMFYYSGHGKMVKNEFRLLPSDYDNNAENSTTIHYENDVLKYLKEIKCKKVVLLDACHSGASGAKDDELIKADDLNSAIDRLNKSAPGMVTISSCSQSELSYESDEWRNSAFSKALCEAFKNEKVLLNDNTQINTDLDKDGLITLKEMIDFIQKRVPDLVRQKKGVSQTPYVPKGDFDESLRFWRVAN
jgi:Caspase domain